MAGVDRRHAAGQQEQERRLRPLQHKGDRVIAFGRDLVEIAVPRLARVEAQFLGRLAGQHVPGAFDIGGGKGLPVMPFDAVAQFEGQRLAVLVPRPALGQLGLDEFQPVLLFVLIEQNEVVEDGHGRTDGRDRRLLVDRHAPRAVAVEEAQRPAALLRRRRGGKQPENRREGRATQCRPFRHRFPPCRPASLARAGAG